MPFFCKAHGIFGNNICKKMSEASGCMCMFMRVVDMRVAALGHHSPRTERYFYHWSACVTARRPPRIVSLRVVEADMPALRALRPFIHASSSLLPTDLCSVLLIRNADQLCTESINNHVICRCVHKLQAD